MTAWRVSYGFLGIPNSWNPRILSEKNSNPLPEFLFTVNPPKPQIPSFLQKVVNWFAACLLTWCIAERLTCCETWTKQEERCTPNPIRPGMATKSPGRPSSVSFPSTTTERRWIYCCSLSSTTTTTPPPPPTPAKPPTPTTGTTTTIMLLQRLHQFCINNSQLFPILLGGNELSRCADKKENRCRDDKREKRCADVIVLPAICWRRDTAVFILRCKRGRSARRPLITGGTLGGGERPQWDTGIPSCLPALLVPFSYPSSAVDIISCGYICSLLAGYRGVRHSRDFVAATRRACSPSLISFFFFFFLFARFFSPPQTHSERNELLCYMHFWFDDDILLP